MIFQQNIPKGLGGFDFGLSQILDHLSPNVLYYAIFALAILMSGVSIILYYPWLRYGFGDKIILLAQILYTLILVLSFIVLVSSTLQYAQSAT